MKTNFVLIDLENLTPDSLDLLAREHFQVRVFVGENQKRLPMDVVAAVQRLGSNAEYVQINGTGPNALDFHIAYYIGRLSVEVPDSFFHVISADKGFDPLIKHLKEHGIFCLRHASPRDIPLVRQTALVERVDTIVEKLLNKPARPKTSAALRRHINVVFANAMSDDQVEEVVTELCRRGLVQEAAGKVTYLASASASTARYKAPVEGRVSRA